MARPAKEGSGISEADGVRIAELANGRLTAHQIAQRIGKNPTSVWWHMLRAGLPMPPPQDQRRDPDKVMSNGKKPYGPDEDRFMLELSEAGKTYHEIAAALTERFGHPRKRHGVKLRLIRLHAYQEA